MTDNSRPKGIVERALWGGATSAVAFVVLFASGFDIPPALFYCLVALAGLAGAVFGPWVMELLSAL